MAMEYVALIHDGDKGPNHHVTQKNVAMAERVAGILGAQVVDTPVLGATFYLPHSVLLSDRAAQDGINGDGDLYGGVVEHVDQSDKAVLHELVGGPDDYPSWYSPQFAHAVEDAVLPGRTIFSVDDALRAYDEMGYLGLEMRLKDPTERRARGQDIIRDRQDMLRIATSYAARLGVSGAVVEANIRDHVNLGLGHINLDGQRYSWIGVLNWLEHEGVTRFGGNEMTVVRGGFEDLGPYLPDTRYMRAVEQAGIVLNAYPSLGARVGRVGFDVVQGFGSNGQFLSGVVDPSMRIGGSSVAEIHGAEFLARNPKAHAVFSRVTLDWSGAMGSAPAGKDLFVETSKNRYFVDAHQID